MKFVTSFLFAALLVAAFFFVEPKRGDSAGQFGEVTHIVSEGGFELVLPQPSIASSQRKDAVNLSSSNDLRADTIPDEPIAIISCSDRSGAPLTGVSISGLQLSLDANESQLGFTDEAGQLELSGNIPAALLIELVGFETKILEQPYPDWGDRVKVILSAAERVEGTVNSPEGFFAGAGVRVLAMPSGAPISKGAVAALIERQRGDGLLTVTDDQGRFAIEGLAPNTRYDIFIAGGGLIGDTGRDSVATGDVDVHIIAKYLHGVKITLRDQSGARLQSSEDVWSFQEQQWVASSMPGVAGVPTDSIHAILAGISIAGTRGAQLQDSVILLSADRKQDKVGPIRASGGPIGYEAYDLEVWVWPLIDELRIAQISLTQTASAFGAIDVTIKWPSGAVLGSSFARPVIDLLLYHTGESELFRMPMKSFSAATIPLAGIPDGQYNLDLTVDFGGYRHSIRDGKMKALVVKSESVEVQIDLSQLGTHAFVFEGEDGVYNEGVMMQVDYHNGAAFVEGAVRFWEKPPYSIPALPKGRYRYYLLKPVMANDYVEFDVNDILETTVILDQIARHQLSPK